MAPTTLVSHGVLTVLALASLFPFVWMASTAFKPNSEVFQLPPRLIGSRIEWTNFIDAWNYLPFGRFMVNGFVVAFSGTLIVLASSSLAGYAFARLNFPGRDNLFVAYLGTLMVPQEALVVPMFLLMRFLGWVDSYQALILPWAFTAFGTFLMRQFFRTIPGEFEESALIDGASRLQVLWAIMLPMARPALAVLGIFMFINYWNSFLWPLIIINSQAKATVPLGLDMFMGQYLNQWSYLMAASMMSMLPAVVLIIALQRYLVEGIAIIHIGTR